jgi:hypothetical protein
MNMRLGSEDVLNAVIRDFHVQVPLHCDRARVAMYSKATLETLIPALGSSLGQVYTQIALVGRFSILQCL